MEEVPIVCECGHLFHENVSDEAECVEAVCPRCGLTTFSSVDDAFSEYQDYRIYQLEQLVRELNKALIIVTKDLASLWRFEICHSTFRKERLEQASQALAKVPPDLRQGGTWGTTE